MPGTNRTLWILGIAAVATIIVLQVRKRVDPAGALGKVLGS